MSELLAVAQRAWPEGWAPALEMGVEDGIVWAITRAPLVGINGYVLIPAEGHPWSAGIPHTTVFSGEDYSYEEYATDDLSVHGGITYGGYGGSGWIGFDTAHSGDWWPPEFDDHGMCERYDAIGIPWAKRWTTQMVIDEAKSLARQVAAIECERPALEAK